MDFAPLFLERAHVSRDPGLNVAYWNLAERNLKRTQQGYGVGDRPLRFFHFSGFDPRDGKLTRFETYHAAADHPDVRHLLEDYSQRLQRAGQDELCGVPDAYTRFGNGLEIPELVLQVNGDMTEAVAAALPRFLWEGRHRIGYWFWELSSLPPQMAAATRHLAALWAPSRFCEEAFRRVVNVPVTWMPLAVSAPAHRPCGKESLGLPRDRFLFFNAFDAASVPERKNPMGLLAAFARVAKRLPGECHLVLKVNNADAVRGLTDELVSAASELPVTLWLEHASRSEMEALLAVCDAYVSLHRSEALGLALIEAMYLGKPVIATGYGGVCDFFDASTGWVVAHRETRLERTLPPYPKGSLWAEPDVDSAAAAMLAVFAGGDEVTLRTRAAHRRVDALYAPQRVADRICAHLAPVLPE
jgi:glycosyltransferase involved in cell wall biosynthesis